MPPSKQKQAAELVGQTEALKVQNSELMANLSERAAAPEKGKPEA